MNNWQKMISEEKNVEIRKREEEVTRRYINILLTFLTLIPASFTYTGKLNAIGFSIFLVIILLVYLFADLKYLKDYREYTNKLIRDGK